MRQRSGGPFQSDYQFQSMQPHDAFAIADRSGNQPHPAVPSPDSRKDSGVQGKTALMLDGMGAQTFHDGTGVLTIKRNCFFSTDTFASGQSEDVINATGSDQRIVSEVTFPATGMVDSQTPYFGRLNGVDDRAVQNAAELEVARLFTKWPAMMELERFGSPQSQFLTLLKRGSAWIVAGLIQPMLRSVHTRT